MALVRALVLRSRFHQKSSLGGFAQQSRRSLLSIPPLKEGSGWVGSSLGVIPPQGVPIQRTSRDERFRRSSLI